MNISVDRALKSTLRTPKICFQKGLASYPALHTFLNLILVVNLLESFMLIIKLLISCLTDRQSSSHMEELVRQAYNIANGETVV